MNEDRQDRLGGETKTRDTQLGENRLDKGDTDDTEVWDEGDKVSSRKFFLLPSDDKPLVLSRPSSNVEEVRRWRSSSMAVEKITRVFFTNSRRKASRPRRAFTTEVRFIPCAQIP
jgi:hypothetical protein